MCVYTHIYIYISSFANLAGSAVGSVRIRVRACPAGQLCMYISLSLSLSVTIDIFVVAALLYVYMFSLVVLLLYDFINTYIYI